MNLSGQILILYLISCLLVIISLVEIFFNFNGILISTAIWVYISLEIYFSIRMRILNSEYFLLDLIEFNWIQLDSIGRNWIEKLHFLFKILNWTVFSIFTKRNLKDDLLVIANVTPLYEPNIDLSSLTLKSGWYTLRKVNVAI